MRKAIVGAILFAMLLGSAFAASTDTEQMTIRVQVAFVGITLYESDGSTPYDTWNIGVTAESAADTMAVADHIEAKNDGNCAIDLYLYSDDVTDLSGCTFGTPTNWSPGAAIGTDVYKLECGIGTDAAQPGSYTTCPNSSADGTLIDSDVAAAATSHMYLMFTTPSSSSDGCQHDATVSVLAKVH